MHMDVANFGESGSCQSAAACYSASRWYGVTLQVGRGEGSLFVTQKRLFFCVWQDSKASALCCTRGACVMNDTAASSRRPSITVRLTPDEKQRFATIAAARGQSESELGLAAVRML